MNQSLRDLCELQIENERIIRGVSFLEDGNVIKVGALFYTMGKATADPEKIRASNLSPIRRHIWTMFLGSMINWRQEEFCRVRFLR